jgi:hypothetical protein
MRQMLKAGQVRTGDLLLRDGKVRGVIQVENDRNGESVLVHLADGTLLWAPNEAVMIVDRRSEVVDLDEARLAREVLYRTETGDRKKRR